MEMPIKGRKLSILQVAKVFAILLVVIGHVNTLFYRNFNFDWFGLGSWERIGGVDFFFVVTGFMIYYIYHRHFGVKGKTREFLIKRFIRIYPLYWLFTFLLLGIAALFPVLHDPYNLEQIWKSFLLFPTQPILTSAWSLSHVIFFYIMFSLVILQPKIFKPIMIFWVMVTILLKSGLFTQWDTFLFSFSTLEIVSGSFIAYIYMSFNLKQFATTFLVVGLIGYCFIWVNNVYFLIPVYYAPVFYCFFALLIVLGISIKDRTERQIPSSLVFLGDASYSIYIAHGPFLILYMLLFRETLLLSILGYTVSMVIIIVLSIASSCLVYVWIEKPLNTYLKRIMIGKRVRKKENVATQKLKGA
ncbi:acyltransferase [Sutcliffiella horikoshii]|uniref:Acyltransferase n=1 Tax=Sutcliffiella horikoshii TaxID=79883 RepID=A0A5D4SY08_9BACI|nr:acyltransferase [Sutcliffiella horikoshii]TYS67178.1 acyltransferase [Sutcliffiella horikoshii]